MLAGEETPCAPQARLYLIDDQQGSALPAQRGQPVRVVLAGYMNAAFSLHQFDKHGCRLLIDGCLRRREVVVANMTDAGYKGREGFAIMRLPGCGKRAHRAAMKAAQRCHDAGASCDKPREFECAFDGLGATVAEKDARRFLRRELREPFEQAGARIVIDNFGAGDEALCLHRQSRRDFWPPVSYTGDAMPGGAIDVLASLVIP